MSVQLKPLIKMSTAEKREAIHKFIDQLEDDRFLHALHAMVKAYAEYDPIIGYDIEGNPKRASVMKAKYMAALEAVEKGEYITIEELEKESEEWLAPTK